MLDGNENNGVHLENSINGNGIVAKPRKKRVSTSDLSARIAELEKKLEAASSIDEKLAQMTDQIAKLDDRVSKIAHAVAQFNLTRPGGLA
jgi:hypothetical protein